jgi:DNA adenine methylase
MPIANRMKPPFSYYGGKQRLITKLIPLIPKHTVYVEPFAGGAALLFAKPWPNVFNNHHYSEVINDTNKDVVHFYRTLRDKKLGPQLVERLSLTLYSRSEHELRNEKTTDPVERAARFYCDIEMSFSNKLGGGWGTVIYGKNLFATWMNKVNRLPEYLSRMASVGVECDDALNVIKRWDSPQTFFYCDPPYPGAYQGHYAGYTELDLENLIKTLDKCEGSFLLSNYDNNTINIPKDWERFEFQAHCSASSKGQTGSHRDKSRAATKQELGNRERTEVVWRRLAKGSIRHELGRLFDQSSFVFAD